MNKADRFEYLKSHIMREKSSFLNERGLLLVNFKFFLLSPFYERKWNAVEGRKPCSLYKRGKNIFFAQKGKNYTFIIRAYTVYKKE